MMRGCHDSFEKIFRHNKSKKKLFQNAANYGGSKRHNLPTAACFKKYSNLKSKKDLKTIL